MSADAFCISARPGKRNEALTDSIPPSSGRPFRKESRREMSGRLRALVLMLALTATAASSSLGAHAAQGHPRVILVTANCSETDFLCPPFVAALRSTGVSGKIISPDQREDAVATLSLLATQGYDLIIVDISWGDTLAQVAPKFPKAHFAIIDVALSDSYGAGPRTCRRSSCARTRRPTSRAGSPARWRSAARAVTSSASSAECQLPGRRRFHRRLHGRRAARLAARPRAQEVLRRLRRSEQVRGDRTQPDRARRRRGVQRRGHLRPRHAAGRQASRRVGRRSRHRPVGPRPAHPHKCRQALRQRHAHAARAGARRADPGRRHDCAHTRRSRGDARAHQSEGAGLPEGRVSTLSPARSSRASCSVPGVAPH